MTETLYVHHRLLSVPQDLNQPLLQETEDDLGPPISHVWSTFVRQVQNCTVEKPYDQRRCSFNHSLTWSSLSLSPLSPSLNMEVIFLQPCWPSLSPLHSTLEDRSDAKRCTDSSMTSLLEFIHHLFWIFISNTHSYTLSWTVGQARRRKEGGERL